MDWAAKWYQERFDEKADPESYDPLAVVAESHERVVRMNRILAAIRTGHPESTLPVLRHLRTAYWQTFLAYRAHDAKFHRGWAVPEWLDPMAVKPATTTAVRTFSIEAWLSKDRWAAATLFSTQLTVFHALNGSEDGMRRSVRRQFNTTATLYVYEAERLAWALDPDRDRPKAGMVG